MTVSRNVWGSNCCFGKTSCALYRRDKEVITTDETWHVRTGQIRYSEIYMGETIDTNAPDIREGKVSAVPEAVFHPTVLTPQLNEPVRVTEHLKAKRVFTDSKGNILVDFAEPYRSCRNQNPREKENHCPPCGDSGSGRCILPGHSADGKIRGHLYPKRGRTGFDAPLYISWFPVCCRGGNRESQPEMFTACVMHSNMRKTGEFRCSNEKVNQLQSNIPGVCVIISLISPPTVLKGMSGLDGWEMRRYSHGQQRSTGRRLCFLQNG